MAIVPVSSIEFLAPPSIPMSSKSSLTPGTIIPMISLGSQPFSVSSTEAPITFPFAASVYTGPPQPYHVFLNGSPQTEIPTYSGPQVVSTYYLYPPSPQSSYVTPPQSSYVTPPPPVSYLTTSPYGYRGPYSGPQMVSTYSPSPQSSYLTPSPQGSYVIATPPYGYRGPQMVPTYPPFPRGSYVIATPPYGYRGPQVPFTYPPHAQDSSSLNRSTSYASRNNKSSSADSDNSFEAYAESVNKRKYEFVVGPMLSLMGKDKSASSSEPFIKLEEVNDWVTQERFAALQNKPWDLFVISAACTFLTGLQFKDKSRSYAGRALPPNVSSWLTAYFTLPNQSIATIATISKVDSQDKESYILREQRFEQIKSILSLSAHLLAYLEACCKHGDPTRPDITLTQATLRLFDHLEDQKLPEYLLQIILTPSKYLCRLKAWSAPGTGSSNNPHVVFTEMSYQDIAAESDTLEQSLRNELSRIAEATCDRTPYTNLSDPPTTNDNLYRTSISFRLAIFTTEWIYSMHEKDGKRLSGSIPYSESFSILTDDERKLIYQLFARVCTPPTIMESGHLQYRRCEDRVRRIEDYYNPYFLLGLFIYLSIELKREVQNDEVLDYANISTPYRLG